MVSRKLRILLAGTILLSAICGVMAFRYQRQLQDPGRDLRVSITSQGGITGSGNGSKFMLTRNQLTDSQARDVVRELDQTKFFSLDSDYQTLGCSDAFITVVTVKLNGHNKSISYDDCGRELPNDLVAFIRYITSLKAKTNT